MARFSYNGNSVRNASVDGLTMSEFLDSGTYNSLVETFDVSEDSVLQMNEDGEWIDIDDNHVLSSTDHFRFTTVGGTKG